MLEYITDLFYPKRCPICDRVLAAGEIGICLNCTTKVEYIQGDVCYRCGKPVSGGAEYCPECEGRTVDYRRGRCLFSYNYAIRESIARFKYHGRREYADYYAQQLYERFGDWLDELAPDALVPVPIHVNRLRMRGYNQSELVAVALGERTGIPVSVDELCRVVDTRPQKDLSEAERKKNLSGAFLLKKNTSNNAGVLNRKPECVIILDDIYTTGSTIEACSRVLKQAGITDIYFLCISVGRTV